MTLPIDESTRILTDLGTASRGKSRHRPRNDPSLYGGKYPFIQTGEIKHANLYITDFSQTYNEAGLAQSRLWPIGTLCITIAANIAETAILKIEACIPDSVIGFIADDEFSDAKFVKYCLETYKLQMQAISRGTTQDNLSMGKLLSIRFKVPCLAEQEKIAAILSSYDDLVEANTKRISRLQSVAQGIYEEWFVRYRFPGKEKSNLRLGKPDWERVTLSIFGDEIREGVKKQDMKDSDLYIGSEHIPRKSIAFVQHATAESVDSNKLRFQHRDILFGKIRPYLHKIALAHWQGGACSTDTIVIRPRHSTYEAFLLFTLFSESFVELATISSKGTKMPRADWDFLQQLEIPMPPAVLLEKYQTIFDGLFAQITLLLDANERLLSTRDLLLGRLISGKLAVGPLDIQFPSSMASCSETSLQLELAHA